MDIMLNEEKRKLRLHLGVGEKYMEDYWNVDFPEGEHTVMKPRVDEYADIRTMTRPLGSMEEIRSHHLFEHFSRAEALKLLVRWRSWLKPGGMLVIETPDFATSASFFSSAFSLRRRFQISRHIYGSQEAGWADHKDYWDKRKFAFVLAKLGFRDIMFRRYWNGFSRHAHKLPRIGKLLERMPEALYVYHLNVMGNFLPESFYKKYGSNKMPNILVRAIKDGSAKLDGETVAREILSMYLVGKEDDRLLNVWLKNYREF